MKKRMLIAAAVAAMTVSGGAWAACTADIDMGSNKIQNLATPMADSDAATKAYVDAIGRLEVSPISSLKVKGFGGAVQFCQHLNDAGTAVEANPVNAGWRLPQNLGEASLGFKRATTPTPVVLTTEDYAVTGSTSPTEFNSIWVAMPVTNANQPANTNLWNDSAVFDNTQWFRARLDGALWAHSTASSEGNFAFCVR